MLQRVVNSHILALSRQHQRPFDVATRAFEWVPTHKDWSAQLSLFRCVNLTQCQGHCHAVRGLKWFQGHYISWLLHISLYFVIFVSLCIVKNKPINHNWFPIMKCTSVRVSRPPHSGGHLYRMRVPDFSGKGVYFRGSVREKNPPPPKKNR